jgi:TetR/AcrR family transcriptional repressor of lmrAB and yxaGH operons
VASDTRDRLIRTTSRLLRQQGYAATGLNQVMAEADAPKGSMYFHFPGGKEELAASAIDRFNERVTARLAAILDESGSVRDAVSQILDDYMTLLERTDFTQGCAVATVAVESAPDRTVLAESTDRALRDWTDLVAAALEAEGRPADEAHRLGTLVIALIEGTVVMGKGERSTEPLVAVRDAVRDLLAMPSPAAAGPVPAAASPAGDAPVTAPA